MKEFLSDPNNTESYSTGFKAIDAPLSIESKKPRSPLAFVKKIFQSSNTSNQEAQLIGRVKQVEALSLGDELAKVLKKLQKQANEDSLLQSLIVVIKNALDELKAISNGRKEILNQGHLVKKLSDWMDSARKLVQISENIHDRQLLAQFIAEQNLNELISRIGRDLHFVKTYPKEAVAVLQVDEDTKKSIIQTLENKLTRYITKLTELNKKLLDSSIPESLEGVRKLKAEVSEQRGSYVNRVFEIVDGLINNLGVGFVQKSLTEDENPRLVKFSKKVDILENEISRFIQKVEAQKALTSSEKSELLLLEEMIDLLYNDVATPTQFIEKLEDLKNILKIFKNKSD